MAIRSLSFGLLFSLLFLISNSAYSQNSDWYFGTYLGVKFQPFVSDFNSIPQLNRPTNINYNLTSVLPINPEIGVSTFYRADWLKFGLTGMVGVLNKYNSDANELTTTTIDGLPVRLTINHKVNFNNYYFSILPEIRINPFDKLNLHLASRYSLNFTDYNYSQTITEPNDIEFTDVTLPKSGSINSNFFNFEFGLSYSLDLSSSWYLTPKLMISLPTNSLPFSTNNNTNTAYFRGGFELEYNKFTKVQLYDTIISSDTTILSSKTKKGVELDESVSNNEIKEDANSITFLTYIKQKFVKYQDEEEKLVIGSITAKFLNDDKTESDKLNLKIKQNIICNYNSNKKLSKTFRIDDFRVKFDTTLVCEVPNVKFYIDYDFEDSLKLWQIEVKSNNNIVKQFVGNNQTQKEAVWFVKEQYKILDLLGKEFNFDFKLIDTNNKSYDIGNGTLLFNYELTSHVNNLFDKYILTFESNLLNQQLKFTYLKEMINYFSKLSEVTRVELEYPQEIILKLEELNPKNKKGLVLKPSPVSYFKLIAE